MYTITIHTTDMKSNVICESIEACVQEWKKHRDDPYLSIGSSSMRGKCGDVHQDGKKVAEVSYNGKVWGPAGYPEKLIENHA